MAKPATRTGATPDAPRSMSLKWRAILGGLGVAYIASVAMGVLLARGGLAGNLSLLPLVQFLGLFAGGYVAGRWAQGRGRTVPGDRPAQPVSGFMNGVVVAVAFIVVWAVQNAVQEAWLVQEYGPVALPRMNMGGIILGDLLLLSGAALGGWLAEREQR